MSGFEWMISLTSANILPYILSIFEYKKEIAEAQIDLDQKSITTPLIDAPTGGPKESLPEETQQQQDNQPPL